MKTISFLFVLLFAGVAYGQTPVINDFNGYAVGIAGEKDGWVYYRMYVPFGAGRLDVRLSGGTGDADVYLSKNGVPTTSNYDFAIGRAGNFETLELAGPQGGEWIIGLYGHQAFENVNLSVQYWYGQNTQSAFLGQSFWGLAGDTDSWRFYRVNLYGSNDSIEVRSSGGQGAVQLYIKEGWRPSRFNYDARSFGGGTWQNVSLDNLDSGTYYIGVRGDYGGYMDVRVRLGY